METGLGTVLGMEYGLRMWLSILDTELGANEATEPGCETDEGAEFGENEALEPTELGCEEMDEGAGLGTGLGAELGANEALEPTEPGCEEMDEGAGLGALETDCADCGGLREFPEGGDAACPPTAVFSSSISFILLSMFFKLSRSPSATNSFMSSLFISFWFFASSFTASSSFSVTSLMR